jgi:putative addiction module component (TIGR02574 family)
MSTDRDPTAKAGSDVSLDEGEDPDAAAAWTAELERRAKRVLSGESQGIPWEDVRARILERLGER